MASQKERQKQKKKKGKYSSARKRSEVRGSGADRKSIRIPEGMSYLSTKKPGNRRLDLVCYELKRDSKFADAGEMHYEHTYYVHPNLGPNNDAYACPKKNANKPCPVCDLHAKMSKKSNADPDEVKALLPKERQLFLAIDKDEPEKGVQLWDQSYHLFGKLLDSRINNADDEDQEQWDNFHLPTTDGSTLKLTFAEKSVKGFNPFTEVTSIDLKQRKTDLEYDEDKVPCLQDLVIIESYDKLKELLYGGAEEEDDDDDDEPKKKSKGSKSKASDDDDDDEDDDDGDDEADDESDDDDDDSDDDDEDGVDVEEGDLVKFKYKGKTLTGIVVEGSDKSKKVYIKEQSKAEKKNKRHYSHAVDPSDIISVLDDDSDDDDDEDDDEPKKKPSSKKKRHDFDEDDEDDDDSDDDDEDDSDDDSDDDDEDEDDDEPPAKKKRARKR